MNFNSAPIHANPTGLECQPTNAPWGRFTIERLSELMANAHPRKTINNQ
jgi:hypothetical protein